jgi:hypothetical protein
VDTRSARKAQRAPAAAKRPTLEELENRLRGLLADDYHLGALSAFTVVLEGATDLRYLAHAASRAKNEENEDLLSVPAQLDEKGTGILLCSPGQRGDPTRGGVKQMVRLARELHPYVFTLEVVRLVVFVFDHDEAGLEARDSIAQFGFLPGTHSLTLDPTEHPLACARKQVVIEDLLSLRIQKEFFARYKPTCSVEFENGSVKRFRWGHQAKGDLCEYVCNSSTYSDLVELVNLLRRIRELCGFPTHSVNYPDTAALAVDSSVMDPVEMWIDGRQAD